jgi:hypothetical protein
MLAKQNDNTQLWEATCTKARPIHNVISFGDANRVLKLGRKHLTKLLNEVQNMRADGLDCATKTKYGYVNIYKALNNTLYCNNIRLIRKIDKYASNNV